jgi:hypothetical protein
MKTIDAIEQNEESLDTILPLDTDAELAEHFGIFVPADETS